MSASPAPDTPHINMHESGIGIIADAAAAEAERRLPKGICRNPFHSYIDGHALHVQAAPRHTGAGAGKRRIGMRRAVTGDYLKGCSRLDLVRQIVEQVEQARVNGVDLSRAVVAQDVVDGGERVWRVSSILPIINTERLACV